MTFSRTRRAKYSQEQPRGRKPRQHFAYQAELHKGYMHFLTKDVSRRFAHLAANFVIQLHMGFPNSTLFRTLSLDPPACTKQHGRLPHHQGLDWRAAACAGCSFSLLKDVVSLSRGRRTAFSMPGINGFAVQKYVRVTVSERERGVYSRSLLPYR